MDILALLRQAHQEIDLYLAALEDSARDSIDTRKRLYDLLLVALETHERAEEEVVYSRLMDPRLGLRPRILRALEEHAVIDRVVKDLGTEPMDAESWLPTIAVLGTVLKLHIDAEEKLFDTIRESLDPEELSELADAYLRKKEALTGPSVVRPIRPYGAKLDPRMGQKVSPRE